ncbi:cell wall-binding repeat-containing protein [Buchananella felis]|uniref:cell wall-binding repeat-containing protein n=1 Tax=Buchananella felis TaxID=3231492 RepID=UPI0035281FA3
MKTIRGRARAALAAACGLLAATSFALLAPAPASAAGAAPAVDAGHASPDGKGEVMPAASPWIERIAGNSRYTTSKAIYFSRAWDYKSIVLASGEIPWDALAATPLAAALGAPVVLTTPGSLHPAAREVLLNARTVGVTDVRLAGGTGSLSPRVEAEVRALGFQQVSRHYGSDRYETASVLAHQTRAEYLSQGKQFNAVFFVDGTSVPDALATGPAAAQENGAILLTDGRRVRPDILGNAQNYGVPMYAVGGAAVAALRGVHVGTLVGADRYDTAVQVARAYVTTTRQLVIASGEDFPDALSGGAMAAYINGALVLTRPNQVPPPVLDYLEPGRFHFALVTGGPKSVSGPTFNRIRAEIGAN